MPPKKIPIDINIFMNGNEEETLNNYKHWEKVPDTYYKKYVGDINVNYEITKKMIDEVKININLIDEMKKTTKTNQSQYIRIVHVTNGEKTIVFYTNSSLLYAIKNRIYYWLKEKKTDLIDEFGKLEGLNLKILEIYKLNANSKVDRIFLDERKKIYINKDKPTFTEIRNKINELLKQEKTDLLEKISYIYKITNTTNNKLFFFEDSRKKLNVTNKLIKELNSKCVKNIDNIYIGDLKLEMIEEYKFKLEIELLLKVDEYMFKNNSINDGLNKCYLKYDQLITENKINDKLIFTHIQKEIANIKIRIDAIDKKTKGYIYQIKEKSQNNNNSYIAVSKNIRTPLKKQILNMYENLIEKLENGEKLNKIYTFLSITEFDKISIKIIDSWNDAKTKAKDKYDYYVALYDTIEKGLNEKEKNKYIKKYKR